MGGRRHRRRPRTVRARVVFVFHRGGAENYNSRLRGVFKFGFRGDSVDKVSLQTSIESDQPSANGRRMGEERLAASGEVCR